MNENTDALDDQPSQNSQPEIEQKKAPDIEAERTGISTREYENYDSGFTTKIDQKIKGDIMMLVNDGHKEKLQKIETVGGSLRLVREDLDVIRGANRVSIELHNRIATIAPERKAKLTEIRDRVEKTRERVLFLVTIKRQLEALLEEMGK